MKKIKLSLGVSLYPFQNSAGCIAHSVFLIILTTAIICLLAVGVQEHSPHSIKESEAQDISIKEEVKLIDSIGSTRYTF